ncbi:MAG: DUF805 domain-containing protein [Streptococcaceae bacterium]|jgi:uncharacterized membrane protein YhaH (DUF805 family)|nr:DUF805 domain-containing protein [Streptococcaceae bacterium]
MAKINESGEKVGFGRAIADFWRGYVDFSGTTTRAGFWWSALFLFLLGVVVTLFAGLVALIAEVALEGAGLGVAEVIVGLVELGLLLPTLALLSRRLRDLGMTNSGIFVNLLVFGILTLASEAFTLLSNLTGVFSALSTICAILLFFFEVEFILFAFLGTGALLGTRQTFWFRGQA